MRRRIADLAVLLAVVSMSLVTWACLCDNGGVRLWESYLIVGTALLLGLAALTRHPGWAAMTRGMMGLWMAVVPTILGISGPARLAGLAMGIVVVMTGVPRFNDVGKPRGRLYGGLAWRQR